VNRNFIGLLLTTCALVACGRQSNLKPLIDSSQLPQTGSAKLVVLPTNEDRGFLLSQAQSLGIKAEGSIVITLEGATEQIAQLQSTKASLAILDEAVDIDHDTKPLEGDATTYYLAKKDFGLPEYWKSHPTHDGRSVIVGVFDDGVPVHASGFQSTSTGKRKILAKGQDGSLLTFKMSKLTKPSDSPFASSIPHSLDTSILYGFIDENQLNVIFYGANMEERKLDFNANGQFDKIAIAVSITSQTRVCVDFNVNAKLDQGECFGTFKTTGEYGLWDSKGLYPATAEFNSSTEEVTLGYGERVYSHGAGVASVLAGHKIGGIFDGVAPGAQIVDFNLFPPVSRTEEQYYSIGKLFRGLEWLAQEGAEVINISYAISFRSAASQEFSRKAFEAITDKYNTILAFSAGNSGPGLGSISQGMVYPNKSFITGAYVSKELDEHVHGTTGLPEEGRVVFYSSRGPTPNAAQGPTLISPLSSLSHDSADTGYMAFSGTSSATPALAGLATVLLSAIKQEALPVDTTAVVNAIRMSGRRLTNAYYIEQGWGLPKIEEAMKIYKELIQGHSFAAVKVAIDPSKTPEGLTSSGLFFQLSEMSQWAEYRATLNGIPPDSLPDIVARNLLQPIDIEYSVPWIKGASKLWLSTGPSSFSFQIEKPSSFDTETEGEIRLLDSKTHQLLHVIPVFIVNDLPLQNSSISKSYTLGAQEGLRLHLKAPAGLKGIALQVKASEGAYLRRIGITLYNPDSKMITANAASKKIFLPIKKPGWYQLTLDRFYGTVKTVNVDLEVTPVYFDLLSDRLNKKSNNIDIYSGGNSTGIETEVQLVETPQSVISEVQSFDSKHTEYKTEVQNALAGFYRLEYQAIPTPELSTAFIWSCVFTTNGPDGTKERTLLYAPNTFELKSDQAGYLQISCGYFEQLDKDKFNPGTFKFDLTYSPTKTPQVYARGLAELRGEIRAVPLRWEKTPDVGQSLRVLATPILGTGSINLGEVKIY